jgi:hypothetical protein
MRSRTFPNVYKIGYTIHLDRRKADLARDEFYRPYELDYVRLIVVPDTGVGPTAENYLHNAFAAYRICKKNGSKNDTELFQMPDAFDMEAAFQAHQKEVLGMACLHPTTTLTTEETAPIIMKKTAYDDAIEVANAYYHTFFNCDNKWYVRYKGKYTPMGANRKELHIIVNVRFREFIKERIEEAATPEEKYQFLSMLRRMSRPCHVQNVIKALGNISSIELSPEDLTKLLSTTCPALQWVLMMLAPDPHHEMTCSNLVSHYKTQTSLDVSLKRMGMSLRQIHGKPRHKNKYYYYNLNFRNEMNDVSIATTIGVRDERCQYCNNDRSIGGT